MSTHSTLITEQEANQLVSLIGGLLRDFLSYAGGSQERSVFADKGPIDDIPSDITAVAKQFIEQPDRYSDNELVAYGADFQQAIAHPVRIEVRHAEDGSGVAQIAARGISGSYRQVVLDFLRSNSDVPVEQFYVRMSGKASFEINRAGVNKALPFAFLAAHWDAILDTIGYQSGSRIDARQTRSIIAADGDGTTWGSPKAGVAPMLADSTANAALLEYLESGGVYIIISGNHLARTVYRVGSHLPLNQRRNLLVCANGGANLVYYDESGSPQESLLYRESALASGLDSMENMDIVYLGDDGRSGGNDREAFEAVGAGRSILVANPGSTDIIPFLINQTIGGWVEGTRRTLEFVNQCTLANPHQNIFTLANIQELVRQARQL